MNRIDKGQVFLSVCLDQEVILLCLKIGHTKDDWKICTKEVRCAV